MKEMNNRQLLTCDKLWKNSLNESSRAHACMAPRSYNKLPRPLPAFEFLPNSTLGKLLSCAHGVYVNSGGNPCGAIWKVALPLE